MGEFTYEQKKEIADAFLDAEVGLGWDHLPDVNSLHDADTKEEIIELCRERIDEEDPFIHLLD